MLRVWTAWMACACLLIGCANDEKDPPSSSGKGGSGSTQPDSGSAGSSDVAPKASLPRENTGDCTTGKWTDVSDQCWACMCGTCESVTNACDESCQDFMNCQASQCFVGSSDEMSCEVRCAMSECLSSGLAAALAAGDLDGCLIAAGADGGGFRRCEAECGFTYAGDTCTNYP